MTDTRWFGHPRGLSTLFFTEMWERFSYYGMRAILVLFMTNAIATGGMGLDDVTATAIYGLYTAAVYVVALPGGWIADRVLGLRRAVFWGGTVIAAGHFTLAIPNIFAFYIGLTLIVIGTGLLKPNISAIVGDLYPEGGARRDAGFSIYYMGINLGGFLGPLICGYLGEAVNWHLGFGAAGVGMVLGLIQYSYGGRHLGTAGELRPEMQAPAKRASAKRAPVDDTRRSRWTFAHRCCAAGRGRDSTVARWLRGLDWAVHRLARSGVSAVRRAVRWIDDRRKETRWRDRCVLSCSRLLLVGLRAGRFFDELVCREAHPSNDRRLGDAGELAAVSERRLHHPAGAAVQRVVDLAGHAQPVDSREDGVRAALSRRGVRGPGVGIGSMPRWKLP